MYQSEAECRRQTINRIHRIQGQLTALEKNVAASQPCEEVVTQARAIEKAMASLISHVFQGYLDNQAKAQMESDSDQVAQDIGRIFALINR